jgi:hypothetical protein
MIGDDSAEVAMGVLKAADHKSDPSRRQCPNPSLQLAFFRAFSPYLAAAAGLMVLPAAFVPAQPFFDADRGLFRTVICVCGHSFRFEQCPRIEMQYALGTESETVFANRRMSRIAASKIF